MPVLETKFFAPRPRRGQVSRPRLLKEVDRPDARLVLVSAPPGFGKSALLAGWLAARSGPDHAISWVSLDPADNDPSRFWTALFTALGRARPEAVSVGTLEMLASSDPPPIEALVAPVLNAVAAAGGALTLILDDYHVIETPAIHGGVAFLLDHMPPRMRLVVASRADPPLPLPRLRARNELVELRAADLRLTHEEAAAFLSETMDLDLAPEVTMVLESRTEGWVAALQLAAISLRGRDDAAQFVSGFAGDDRYIVDYLVDEVLRRQPAGVREFLLKTSIVDSFCAPLCDALTGVSDGRSTLQALERGNLFVVPLDDKRAWYRYHHLFADVLRTHLAETHGAEVPVLHSRASEWLEANGQVEPAITHALAAGDFTRAALLVERQAEATMQDHRPDRLLAWLKPIPDSVIGAMPVLSTYFGHALQGMGDMEGSARRLADAERALAAGASGSTPMASDPEALRTLPSRIASGKGYLAMAAGDLEAVTGYARQALETLEDHEHHWRGTAAALLGLSYWARGQLNEAQALHAEGVANFERAGDTGLAITSAYHDASLLIARGKLREAERRYERSLAFAARRGPAGLRYAANLHIGASELACERNDHEAATRHLRKAEDLGIFPPRTPFRHCLARARLLQSEGDFAGAFARLEEAERLQIRGAIPDFRPVSAWKARLLIALGSLDEAVSWARQRALSPDDAPEYLREYEHLTLARLLIARGAAEDLTTSSKLLQRLLASAEAGGRTGAVIETLALLAVVHRARGDVPGATSSLRRALELAAPEGFVRVFVEMGAPVAALVERARDSGTEPIYCDVLLRAFKGAAPRSAMAGAKAGEEPMSDRELEVLRLLATDLSGPEIARELVVSLNTLRTHTKNIYAKLGVGSRRAAVSRAAELHIR